MLNICYNYTCFRSYSLDKQISFKSIKQITEMWCQTNPYCIQYVTVFSVLVKKNYDFFYDALSLTVVHEIKNDSMWLKIGNQFLWTILIIILLYIF